MNIYKGNLHLHNKIMYQLYFTINVWGRVLF